MLTAVDLEPIDQQVYEALVDSRPTTLEELHGDLRLGRDVLRRAVEALEARGLVSRTPGSPARYSAVAPDIALEVLFLEREEQLKRARLYAEQLTARFHRAASGRDPAELLEIITGRAAIRQRWEQMQRSTRREFRGVDKPPYSIDKPLNPGKSAEAERLKEGIRYRVIYDSEGLATFHTLKGDVEESISLGEQARVLTNAPLKLMISDERLAMLPLQRAPDAMESLIIVHPSGLLEALCVLFESLWNQALPLPLPAASAGGERVESDRPTPDEARLLAMLVTGMPDEAIAKHLGVSYRTFQRRLRDLMNRLGAETRFQAGLRAAHLNWIPSPG